MPALGVIELVAPGQDDGARSRSWPSSTPPGLLQGLAICARCRVGSEAESMAFTDDGIEYGAAGLAHAVDTQSPINGPAAVLAYAICGKAVRAWPDQPFDSGARGVHDACAAMSRRD